MLRIRRREPYLGKIESALQLNQLMLRDAKALSLREKSLCLKSTSLRLSQSLIRVQYQAVDQPMSPKG